MNAPGWYPDPAGREGHVRYWDGQRWGGETQPANATGAHVPPAPQPAPRRPLWPVAAGVTLLVAALAAWALWPKGATDHTGDDKNVPQGPGTPITMLSEWPAMKGTCHEGNAKPPSEPYLDDQLHAVGLLMPIPDGFETPGAPTGRLATEASARRPQENGDDLVVIGLLPYQDGVTIKDAAWDLAQCWVTKGPFEGYSGRYGVAADEPTRIHGREAYWLQMFADGEGDRGKRIDFVLARQDIDDGWGVMVASLPSTPEALVEAEWMRDALVVISE